MMERMNKKWLLRTCTFIACTASALLVGTAWGDPHPGPSPSATIHDWQSRLDLAQARLRAGDFKSTHDISDALLQEMKKRIDGGPNAGVVLGQTIVLRALGEAGRNQMRDALWDWHTARALNPALSEADLAAFGPAGATLRTALAHQVFVQDDQVSEGVTPPVKIKGKPPTYPPALKSSCAEGTESIEANIDQEGYAVEPRSLQSSNPLFTLAALEAFKTWRYKPATENGKPTTSYFKLYLTFKMEDCPHPAAASGGNGSSR